MGAREAHDLSLKTPDRVVAILGMHRSGTSCLTGTLQEAGLFLDDCHTWNKHNEKGNRENQKFVDLHDAILEANGGAWDLPPAKVIWKDEHVAAAQALLADHAGAPNFGFGDSLTLDAHGVIHCLDSAWVPEKTADGTCLVLPGLPSGCSDRRCEEWPSMAWRLAH